MKIIFIRHGDPDYSIDSLTEKGWREAKLLAKRVAKWDGITDYYCSPLGRAKDTCQTCLEPLGKKAEILDWAREFVVTVKQPEGGTRNIPWDYLPEYWTKSPYFYDKDNWVNDPLFEGSMLKAENEKVKDGTDELLARYGYHRDGNMYASDNVNDDTVIVIFCHLGVSFLMTGYLLGISPEILWHTFFTAPTAVTVLGTEERIPHKATFRVQVFGDTTHLKDGNEPISGSGSFTDIFQG